MPLPIQGYFALTDGVNLLGTAGNPLVTSGGGGGGGAVTVADGADVAEGAVADAIVAAGAVGTLSAKLRRVTQGLEDLKTLIVLGSSAFDVATTVTRPANTTPYTAGDVLGGALDLGVLGPSARAVMITGVQLAAYISAIPSGQVGFELHLYNVTPPSAFADNAAWTGIPAGDRASYLGFVTIPPMVAKGTAPATCYSETASPPNKQVILSGTHLFGYLVTLGGFTPAANSEVYVPTVHTQAV